MPIMAAERADLPDLSALSEEERKQVILVLQKAKEFEAQEEKHLMSVNRLCGWQPLEGQLYKYTNVMKGWQYRWFVLDPEAGRLEYFEKEEHKKQRPRGSVHLAGAVISPSDEDSQTFTVNAANGEIYRLRASDAKERQHWVNRLRATSEFHTDTIAQNAPPLPKEVRPLNFGSHHSLNTNKHEGSVDNLPSDRSGCGSEGADRPRATSFNNIVNTLGMKVHKNVVTHRMHKAGPTVVTTQSADTFRSVKEMLSTCHGQEGCLMNKIEELPPTGEYINSLDQEILLLKATSNATLMCLEQCLQILHHQQHQQQQQQQLPPVVQSGLPGGGSIEWLDPKSLPGGVPEVSYDSDDLRDSDPRAHGSRSATSPGSPAESFVSAADLPVATEVLASEEAPLDHQDEVEDEGEYTDTELEGVEEHKSIILHLLSQLKLGMDLTKVVLPTFILEKRSLLEMFADCMAHPDVFLSIPEQSNPESRMVAMLEWYLTSFHASRKGAVAKKPYNPIIGEKFYCSWKLPKNTCPESPTTGNDDETWLYYSAEQVSHHPPISAFYFECPEKQMSMNGSIWTKSKFMGMSIGVVMVGKVCLNLLGHGEEYQFSLPSAYARSILTVPWVEMGDRVTISCTKTNYHTSVIFHTKPFYGGKLHRVTAEVKNPSGEVVCRVNGEWNGCLEFTFQNGETKVVDTVQLKTVRKRVRPRALQSEFESRKLWHQVTNALRNQDIDTATQHKRFLEERQRQGERHRKETNTAFPTKHFHLAGETWLYNKPLSIDKTPPTV